MQAISVPFPSVLVPVSRLADLRADIAAFKAAERLNGFQSWIVDHLYDLEPPETGFPVRSVLLLAITHPMYSEVTLSYGGRRVSCRGLVSPDFNGARRTVAEAAREAGMLVAEAEKLPFKRLGVRSGLAAYGRNNITYVEGLGSSFSYLAFFTDRECGDRAWVEVRTAPRCASCVACRSACPTGAILPDRFLIDNERCLSCMNEVGDPFPPWLPVSVHHTLYDCLACQLACPMNKDRLDDVGVPIDFDEAETEALRAGVRFGEYPDGMKEKAAYLGLDQWPDGIAKTVKLLLER